MSESEIETKHFVRPKRFTVTVTQVTERDVKRRSSTYKQGGGYDYGQWYDDTEEKSETIFQQSFTELDLASLVLVVNKLKTAA